MYCVTKTGEIFYSFSKACEAGKESKSEVIDVKSNLRRWSPAVQPSAKKLRMYKERLNAYNSQKNRNQN